MPSFCRVATQAFLEVYATLRVELLNDKLLEGQPEDARNWLREVSPGIVFASAADPVDLSQQSLSTSHNSQGSWTPSVLITSCQVLRAV